MDRITEKYAELIIKTGVNLQRGQTLFLSSPVDAAPFARECVKAAYAAGCHEVEMRWMDSAITREKYLHADDAVFDTFHQWSADPMNVLSGEGAAFLFIDSDDPEALSGVDPDRIRRASVVSGRALRPFRDRETTDYMQWCIAAYPNVSWARKVFPGLSDEDAVKKLWDAILFTMRVTADNDPVAEWTRHNAELKERKEKLNSYNFKYLKYKNSLGTDLTIELPEGHFWDGGDSFSAEGVRFNANMPTEEIFTAPKRDGVNGIVCSAKPLSLNGDIAENFRFTLENGKIVKVEAEKGQQLLEASISVDEGAAYLGEVALVPYDSPISNSGILFYNTLFDENASCHLAFGDGYPCIDGGRDMSREELLSHGVNHSMMHVDFMVGTSDLSITGITHEDKDIPVFVDGNFAF